MGGETTNKINRLQRDLPEGLLVDTAWLNQRGYYPSLRQKYVDRGWLTHPARGVYRRPRGPLTWEQVVISLQSLLEFPVVVGGRTALELQGYAHYLSQNVRAIHLYTPEPLPHWLQKLKLEARFRSHNAARLFPNDPSSRDSSDTGLDTHGEADTADNSSPGCIVIRPWGPWSWPMTLSAPERALLELLDELPAHESFHQVDMLMGGLASLSPRRLQVLLEDCRSVKVKRLFFFFATRHNHAWLDHLDKRRVDLGKGKRLLVRGGKLDPTYLITVPDDLDAVR